MTKPRIVVCDDSKTRADAWALAISDVTSGNYEVVALKDGELEQAAKTLRERRTAARNGRRSKAQTAAASVFDEAHVAIIDYDLVKVDPPDGETLAYLVRCFSSAAAIVVVNRDRGDLFDLRLKGDPDSWADFDVSDRQAANAGLWLEPWDGFRPWHWPLLPQSIALFHKNVKRMIPLLDEPIVSVLGMSEEMTAVLPSSLWEHLHCRKDRAKTTLRDVVKTSRMGLRPKDKLVEDAAFARVGVARLSKWLRQLVLPGQHVLVDAPHLASRLPSLLGAVARNNPVSLDKLCSLSQAPPRFFDADTVKQYLYDGNGMLDRPTWFWPGVSKDMRIADVKEPWSAVPLEFVFCEDVSRFVPKQAARQFRAEVTSPYASRYVVDPKSPKLKATLKKATKGISYIPPTRFAL